MGAGMVSSEEMVLKRKVLRTILSTWEKYSDVLLSVYNFISGSQITDALGGTALELSESISESYIPADYTGTITAPDSQAFKNADAEVDNLWFTDDEANHLTVANLISQEYNNTLVKYSDQAPYNVYVIGVIKAGVTLTEAQMDEISDSFDLWVFHFGTWRDAGSIKENRTF